MKAHRLASVAVLALGPLVYAAEPTESLSDAQRVGQTLFNDSCAFCHGVRGHATTLLSKRLGSDTAVLERRTDLSAELIRHVVRHGINSMPWYRRAELSDAQLESIVAYLTRNK